MTVPGGSTCAVGRQGGDGWSGWTQLWGAPQALTSPALQVYKCCGGFCAITQSWRWGISHPKMRGSLQSLLCHSLFYPPDRGTSAATCSELDVGQKSHFFFSLTILQVHVFGDSHKREVQKELVWVDQNNKNHVVFPPHPSVLTLKKSSQKGHSKPAVI